METIGCRIEDPEYDLYLSAIEEVQEIEQITEAPKRGRKPKIQEDAGI